MASNVYNPESSTRSDIIVNDKLVGLYVTLSFQSLDMMKAPGNTITMIALLNIHAPIVTLVSLRIVTVLPTCNGLVEAYILWLCAGARNRKQGTDNIQSPLNVVIMCTRNIGQCTYKNTNCF